LLAFADAARHYWLGVFPCGRRELRHWRSRAAEILDPALRRLAFEAQDTRRESLEGAVAFATFVPRASRAVVVRAITAYQLAFDYIDTISEQPGTDPIVNGRRLNQALLRALDSGAPHLDYYAHHSQHEDAGYLQDLVDTCRTALEALPSYGAISDAVLRATTRLVNYQSLNHGDGNGSYEAFAQWARTETVGVAGLHWWEVGAAAGSPLPVFALFATGARPAVCTADAAAVEGAYFPWIASLSSLLDSLVDRSEDAADGQRSLLDYYDSPAEIATRLQTLAARAAGQVRVLADGEQHTMILAAMASFFHDALQRAASDDCPVTQRILDTMAGDFTTLATLVLRTRGVVRHLHDGVASRNVLGTLCRVRTVTRSPARSPELHAHRAASGEAAQEYAAHRSAHAEDRRAAASRQYA
jgi:tetraprenyl-beta-curcumene synthase